MNEVTKFVETLSIVQQNKLADLLSLGTRHEGMISVNLSAAINLYHAVNQVHQARE